jgi:hypothetical protein
MRGSHPFSFLAFSVSRKFSSNVQAIKEGWFPTPVFLNDSTINNAPDSGAMKSHYFFFAAFLAGAFLAAFLAGAFLAAFLAGIVSLLSLVDSLTTR